MIDDDRLKEAQSIPIEEVAERLAIDRLTRSGRERTGPCPRCGGDDRFSINTIKGVWNCRHGCSDGLGADGIGLVRLVMNCEFGAAVDYLVGAAEIAIDPEERARRERERERDRRRKDDQAARYRRAAILRARDIWHESVPAAGSPVADYLEQRGIRMHWLPRFPPTLRFHPALPYMVQDHANGGQWVEAHRGPAMIAAVTDAENRVVGVHRTWLDPRQRKGTAVLTFGGQKLKAKKTWGHVKGCAIRLGGEGERTTLVMGEGIETTLSARVARPDPGCHFWAGISMGNMAGRRKLGPGLKYAGIPDLEDDEAFLPPVGVRELVFVQDGDSEPRLTRAQMLAGLRRAKASISTVERIRLVHPGEGRDLNDLLMGARDV